mmetsp:Transcript_14007/g.39627  ORF Transcript_14007/g.39627 Transcript_14007/m.39627 type:complete len:247 (-) Transcript_14007:162-902(-)
MASSSLRLHRFRAAVRSRSSSAMLSDSLVLARRTLPQPACSAEFCRSGAALDLLAVGTYLLADRETQTKTGCVHLFRVGQETASTVCEDDDHLAATPERPDCLQELASLPTTAVFDIKWRPSQPANQAMIGVAGADSKLSIAKFEVVSGEAECGNGGCRSLHIVSAEPVGEDGAMALSLDWGHASCQDTDSVVVSSSDGTVAVLKVAEAGVKSEVSFKAHDLETWVVAKDRWQVCSALQLALHSFI